MSKKKILEILLIYIFVVEIALILLDFSLYTFVVAGAAGVAGSLFIIFYWYKKTDRKNYKILVLLILLIYLLPQIIVLTNIELEYSKVKSDYMKEYQYSLNYRDNNELNASWNILGSYNKEFEKTYAISTPPSRFIFRYVKSRFLIYPILWQYFKLDGFNKLLVVQSRGGCGEFAWTAAFFLNDVTGLNTRVVSFEGIDHAFPEVEVNNVWWVFDLVYTTPYYPIEAHNFASHLKMQNFDLYNYVANLKKRDTGETLLAEHGFSPSNLTITTIRDITNNPSDDEPATNAEVEIFAFQNRYDPLVAKGGTDNFGNYTVTLNSGKEYLILVKEGEPIPIVGLDRINLSSPNESIVVYLHKYE